MIDVAVRDGTLAAVDVAKNEVAVAVDGWSATAGAPPLDRDVDAAVAGVTRELAFAESTVAVEREDAAGWALFDDRAGPLWLPAGRHVVQVATTVRVFVATGAPCRLSRDRRDGSFRIRFERPTPVTVGFRSLVDGPRDRVVVPRTLAGAAAAVRHLASAIETDTPDRSYPTQRAHPPAVAFGPAVEVPARVRERAAHPAVVVTVPERLGPLYVVAPLAYYLGADVRLADVDAATVDAPTLAVPVDLGAGPDLEAAVADLLHRAFYLDCLVRTAGPYGVELREASLLDRLGIDAAAVYAQSGAERLATYLDLDYDRIRGRLPAWSHGAVVAPTIDNLPALSTLCDRLSLVERPRPEAVSKRALLAETVGRPDPAPWRSQSSPSYDLVRNETRLATHQSWLAPGTPVGAARATPAAFEHRFDYPGPGDGARQVLVVINDDAMLEERTGVERIYRERATELAIEVDVAEAITREALADHLRSPVDFLHYVGHCDAAGLRCADGWLDVGGLERTTVRTFFLNACGSFDQGLELVRRGSVAGAVTVHDVLNPDATRVGLRFARLVMHGFSVETALDLARRPSLASPFYTVVGDGAHRLAQGEDTRPAVITATPAAGDRLAVRFDFPPGTDPGSLAKPALADAEAYVLRGCPYETVLDRTALAAFLREVAVPVVYDGGVYWSTELAPALAAGEPPRDPV